MSRILNLTQHLATPDQIEAGVYDITEPQHREILLRALTFETVPGDEDVVDAAEELAGLATSLAEDGGDVMIGGAPFLMHSLHVALVNAFLNPVYAFSVRKSVEKTMPDGSVQKASVFQHAGFVRGL